MSSQKESRPVPRLPKGFRDITPQELILRREIIESIRTVYELYGFVPYDTPAIEYVEVLGKYLPESDTPEGGIFSFKDDSDEWIALRYDLTAPLSRMVAANYLKIPKPFRRYQVSPVWRLEKPGPGRFREFIQFDIDSVGTRSPAADAEVCCVLSDAFAKLGLTSDQYIIAVNNRKILNGVLEAAGIKGLDAQGDLTSLGLSVMRSMDKLDRLGLDGVMELLGKGRLDESGDFTPGAGLSTEQIDKVIAYLRADVSSRKAFIASLEPLIAGSKVGGEGLQELAQIDELLEATGYGEDKVIYDPSIVRGLDYYTGAVFEARLCFDVVDEKGEKKQFGSVGGGGRYDNLVQRFTGQKVPATGASIGVDRLIAALMTLDRFNQTKESKPVLVTVMDRERLADYAKMTFELRRAGICAEMYIGSGGFVKQLKYADQRDLVAVVIAGSNEFEAGKVTIKDLQLGRILSQEIKDRDQWLKQQPSQISVPQAEMVKQVRRILERYE